MSSFSARHLPLISVLASLGCAHSAANTPAVFPLHWSGVDTGDMTSLPPGAAGLIKGATVAVTAGADQRPDHALVGRNIQDKAHPITVSTTDDVAGFVASQLGIVLTANGATVVPSGAPRSIVIGISELYVEEENVYQGHATLAVTVNDSSGKQVWTGTATGSSNKWGHSFDKDNYLEAFSNAILDAYMSLFKAPGFLDAVKSA